MIYGDHIIVCIQILSDLSSEFHCTTFKKNKENTTNFCKMQNHSLKSKYCLFGAYRVFKLMYAEPAAVSFRVPCAICQLHDLYMLLVWEQSSQALYHKDVTNSFMMPWVAVKEYQRVLDERIPHSASMFIRPRVMISCCLSALCVFVVVCLFSFLGVFFAELKIIRPQ